jgi:hypothetical protein
MFLRYPISFTILGGQLLWTIQSTWFALTSDQTGGRARYLTWTFALCLNVDSNVPSCKLLFFPFNSSDVADIPLSILLVVSKVSLPQHVSACARKLLVDDLSDPKVARYTNWVCPLQ